MIYTIISVKLQRVFLVHGLKHPQHVLKAVSYNLCIDATHSQQILPQHL